MSGSGSPRRDGSFHPCRVAAAPGLFPFAASPAFDSTTSLAAGSSHEVPKQFHADSPDRGNGGGGRSSTRPKTVEACMKRERPAEDKVEAHDRRRLMLVLRDP